MIELINPMMEITTFVNNKLDLCVNNKIKESEDRIQALEETLFGGKGQNIHTKFELIED